jgi:phosphatidylserine/phosphatidylglycerophosphate/cardiolipin synthase-like enzyme
VEDENFIISAFPSYLTGGRLCASPIWFKEGTPVPIKKILARSNCDTTTIIWQSAGSLAGCRGFALERQVKGQTSTSFVPTWVGFKGVAHKTGQSEPSTVWPIQRYIWSDFLVQAGQTVRYRAIPMVGPAASLAQAPASEWSAWSNWATVATGQTKNFLAYFNRGIVPAQWLAAQSPNKKSLQSNLDTPGDKNRNFLSGQLRVALLGLLAQAKKDGVEIYLALYELNDPELIAALKAIGGKCNLILGSGAFKPGEPDENAAVRKDLQLHSSINVHDRLVTGQHFAHNKFIVFCDSKGKPATLWTGSTNWTMTGLCTQVNNGVLITSPQLAAAYLARWNALKDAGATYPPSLAQQGSIPAKTSVGNVPVTAWNVVCLKLVDLADANAHINAAKDGVLFLMFNPGPRGTLLNTILALDPTKLFIHGVVNQDPGGKKAPILTMVQKGTKLPPKPLSVITPRALQNPGTWFNKEFTFNSVMIHSKVIVIDPFGTHPVVMTGSHNMGPKASKMNDDNLAIIENASGLAAEYAQNILGVFSHYKWLYNLAIKNAKGPKTGAKSSPQYDGNFDNDTWQSWYQSGVNLREIDFWLS